MVLSPFGKIITDCLSASSDRNLPRAGLVVNRKTSGEKSRKKAVIEPAFERLQETRTALKKIFRGFHSGVTALPFCVSAADAFRAPL